MNLTELEKLSQQYGDGWPTVAEVAVMHKVFPQLVQLVKQAKEIFEQENAKEKASWLKEVDNGFRR